jgi:hypothetical protein
LLDGLEEGDALFGRFEAPGRGQQHRRHQRDATDPENYRQDMNSAGERYIIHEAIFAPLFPPFSPAVQRWGPVREECAEPNAQPTKGRLLNPPKHVAAARF